MARRGEIPTQNPQLEAFARQICEIAGVQNPSIIRAFSTVDRTKFYPGSKDRVLRDEVLPLLPGSTISQPSLTAQMINALDLMGQENVLEIGTASGYAAALLSMCAKRVHTVEYNPTLARVADRTLRSQGYRGVHVHIGDGAAGYRRASPYDAIMVTAGARKIPQALADQLRVGGRIVIPVGNDPDNLKLIKGKKEENGSITVDEIGDVGFVLLYSNRDGGWTREMEERIRSYKLVILREQVAKVGIDTSEVDDDDLLNFLHNKRYDIKKALREIKLPDNF